MGNLFNILLHMLRYWLNVRFERMHVLPMLLLLQLQFPLYLIGSVCEDGQIGFNIRLNAVDMFDFC